MKELTAEGEKLRQGNRSSFVVSYCQLFGSPERWQTRGLEAAHGLRQCCGCSLGRVEFHGGGHRGRLEFHSGYVFTRGGDGDLTLATVEDGQLNAEGTLDDVVGVIPGVPGSESEVWPPARTPQLRFGECSTYFGAEGAEVSAL